MLLHGFDRKCDVFRSREAANISTFGPKLEGSFPVRRLPAPQTEVAGIQPRPKFVQKTKLALGSASWGGVGGDPS